MAFFIPIIISFVLSIVMLVMAKLGKFAKHLRLLIGINIAQIALVLIMFPLAFCLPFVEGRGEMIAYTLAYAVVSIIILVFNIVMLIKNRRSN